MESEIVFVLAQYWLFNWDLQTLEEGSVKSQHEDYEKLSGFRHCYPPFYMQCLQLYCEKSAAAIYILL